MQCLQYVFYSLLSLQKHSVCVKTHQNNLCPVLKFLDPPLNTHAKDKHFIFLNREMLMKPLGVKTQNVKFCPLGPFSHDATQLSFFDILLFFFYLQQNI